MAFTIRLRILFAMLWNNKDVRFVLINILMGRVLQYLAGRLLKYIENHPEVFEEAKRKREKAKLRNKNKNPLVLPRGGALVVPPEVFQVIKYLNETGVLKLIHDSGIVATIVSGMISATGSYIIKQIPLKAINTYVVTSVPGALPATHGYKYIEKRMTVFDDVGSIHLQKCEENLQYLFTILQDSTVPFEEKERLTLAILTKYLNLNTPQGRLNFVLCLVFIIYLLSIYAPGSYHIILRKLIEAIKQGKISKKLARLIIRRLQRKGVLIEPELLDIAYSSDFLELP
jgi:hypothetical protein